LSIFSDNKIKLISEKDLKL
jgi:hypothetical protein